MVPQMAGPYKKQGETLRSVQAVVTAFQRYIEGAEKSLVKGFSREELGKTLNAYSSSRGDRESGWYRAISRRLEEMDREEQNQRKNRDRIIDWVIGFIVGVGALLVGELILKKLLK